MAQAFRSNNVTTYASRTNTTITAPAGIQNGDILIIFFLVGLAIPPLPTPPAGFTLLMGPIIEQVSPPTGIETNPFSVHHYCWIKTASGESGNYTVTHAVSNSQGYMVAVSGVGTQQAFITSRTGFGTTTTATGLTTQENNTFILFISSDFGNTANSLSVPAGTTPTFTQRVNPSTTSGLLCVGTGVLATAGATGNKSITNNSNGTAPGEPWSGYLLAFNPIGNHIQLEGGTGNVELEDLTGDIALE
jgi:hypothetical protein